MNIQAQNKLPSPESSQCKKISSDGMKEGGCGNVGQWNAETKQEARFSLLVYI